MAEDLIRLEKIEEETYEVVYSKTEERVGKVRANEQEAELQSIEEGFSPPDYELFLEEAEIELRSILDTDNYYRLVEQVDNYARY